MQWLQQADGQNPEEVQLQNLQSYPLTEEPPTPNMRQLPPAECETCVGAMNSNKMRHQWADLDDDDEKRSRQGLNVFVTALQELVACAGLVLQCLESRLESRV